MTSIPETPGGAGDAASRGAAPTALHRIEHIGWALLFVELLLGVAHMIWPEYRWGQARSSYLNFENRLSLPSWFLMIQLALVGAVALIAYVRERARDRAGDAWLWLAVTITSAVLSFAEFTRFHHRFELVDRSARLTGETPDPFPVMAIQSLWLMGLALGGWLVLAKTRGRAHTYGMLWLGGYSIAFLVRTATALGFIEGSSVGTALVVGLGHLLGTTFLLIAVSGVALAPRSAEGVAGAPEAVPARLGRVTIIGIFSMTFTIIFLQVMLLRLLSIFGDYLTSNTVISIALLGISVGGLLGFLAARRASRPAMAGAALLLPVGIVAAFGTIAAFGADAPGTAIVLAVPFALASTVITVALSLGRSHVVYAVDLLGAAAGALVVAAVFVPLREESGMLALAAFACLGSLCFIRQLDKRRWRLTLALVAVLGAGALGWAAGLNLVTDTLNVTRQKVRSRGLVEAEVLHSRSTFVGRFDVIRRRPHYVNLSTYENGQITDNIRPRPYDMYQIDPRIPDDLIEDPVILILGTSGDGVLKSSRVHASKVYGVEINAAVVEVHKGPLAEFNRGNYDGVEMHIGDGRNYLEHTDLRFDMITLMNVHMSRGRTRGRAPSTEYLHTKEAISTYLDRLTDRGIVNVEEVISHPRREPPVWKMLWTMRQALLERGVESPEQHLFVFQWRTARNNYVQILLKKRPFTEEELSRLRGWLDRCDKLRDIERTAGRILGPITTKTTLLHAPDEPTGNNASRIARGEVSDAFRQAHNLVTTTDDRPFHFDVDPRRPSVRDAYSRTFVLLLVLVPFFVILLRRHRGVVGEGKPFLLVVTLTGLGYFLLEVVLIQRYTIYLGSPTVTFTTVLGTLLLFSGFGSLASGRLANKGVLRAIGALLGLVAMHMLLVPPLFRATASFELSGKVVFSVLTIAPLAFLMGLPFPYVMRRGQTRFGATTAAMLFALNGAASAIAVPLSMNLSSAWGFSGVLAISFVTYTAVGFLLWPSRPRRARFVVAASVTLILFLLVSPWVLVWGVSRHDELRLYAVHYGSSFYQESKVFFDGSEDERERFHWWFWVVRGHGRTVLIDTGFEDPERAQKWRIKDYRSPTQALRDFGIDPEDVTDVVLTHLHWDHVGSIANFSKAQIWVQEKEFEYARSRVTPERPSRNGMKWPHIESLIQAQAEQRLHLVNESHELIEGIRMIEGGAHTPGFQHVEVDTINGTVVVASDAVYVHENNVWHRPTGSNTSTIDNLSALRAMQGRAASTFLIIAGHEFRYKDWFPRVEERVLEIVMVPDEGELD